MESLLRLGKTVYFRLNLLNGDIDNYLEKESIGEYKDFVGDPLTGNDVYYIQKNFEHPENNKIFICDINKNELIELGGKIYNRSPDTIPHFYGQIQGQFLIIDLQTVIRLNIGIFQGKI